MRGGNCKHCGTPYKWLAGRGLCQSCHRNPEIKALYPLLQNRQHSPKEETLEDLERLIAEQMRNLPAWWHESQDRDEPPSREALKQRRRRARQGTLVKRTR